ncbi:MAG: YbaN family protein [Rikenellaceae bacterium]
MFKLILLLIGFLAMGLGVLGIFLPVLPTTPLLLLALWCFTRSSDRWRTWLLANKYFGDYLDGYFSGKGIYLSTKVYAISLLWLTLSYCAYILDNIYLRILFLVIAISVTIHLCMLKTRNNDKKDTNNNSN